VISILPVCVSVYPPPQITFECLNQSLWNLVCISWQLSPSQRRTSKIPFINQCVCVTLLLLQSYGSVKCIPDFGARERLGKHVPAAMNTRKNRRIVGRVIFMRSISYPGSLSGFLRVFPYRCWVVTW
jgi:hypothetical protein